MSCWGEGGLISLQRLWERNTSWGFFFFWCRRKVWGVEFWSVFGRKHKSGSRAVTCLEVFGIHWFFSIERFGRRHKDLGILSFSFACGGIEGFGFPFGGFWRDEEEEVVGRCWVGDFLSVAWENGKLLYQEPSGGAGGTEWETRAEIFSSKSLSAWCANTPGAAACSS